MAAAPIAARRPLLQNIGQLGGHGQECRPRTGLNLPQCPELEPASASTDDHNDPDRVDPAPITIEALIFSSPASTHRPRPNRQEDLGSMPDATHLTPRPLRPAPRTAAACKKRFCLLLSRLTKVGRLQARRAPSSAGGETAVEVEFGFDLKSCPTSGPGARHQHTPLARRAACKAKKPQYICCPPLIDNVDPVMNPASGATRKVTARAISSG